jgi:hypothetical protein
VVEPLPAATVSTLTRTGASPGIGYTPSGAYVVTAKVASPPAWFTEGAGLPPTAAAPPVYEYIPPPPMQLLHPKWAMVFMTSCVGAILFFCYSSYKQQLRETAEREALLFEKREKEQAEESGGQYGSTARGDDGGRRGDDGGERRSSRKAQPAPLASPSSSRRRDEGGDRRSREDERGESEERVSSSKHSSSRRGSDKSSRRDKPSSSSRRERERDDASAASVELNDYAAPGEGDQAAEAPKKSLLRRVASKPLGAVYSMFSSKQ